MFIYNESALSGDTTQFNTYEFLYESVMYDIKLYKAMVESDIHELYNNAIDESAMDKVKDTLKQWCEFIRKKISEFKKNIYIACKEYNRKKKSDLAARKLLPADRKKFTELSKQIDDYSMYLGVELHAFATPDNGYEQEELDEFLETFKEMGEELRKGISENSELLKYCDVPVSKYRFEKNLDTILKLIDEFEKKELNSPEYTNTIKQLIATVSNEYIKTVSPIINRYL